MSDVNAQDVVVGEDDDHSNLIKVPQHETAVSPCINRTKPAVKIEVTGIQLDVEHAWENGYKAGAPGFLMKLGMAIFGSGVISLLTTGVTVGLKYYVMMDAANKGSGQSSGNLSLSTQETTSFIVALLCFVFGGILCIVSQAMRPSKEKYIKGVMTRYQGG